MPEYPDDILIQRCIDGELDSTAETVLLQELDRQASGAGWRTLALAFLEDRLFRTASLQHLDRTQPAPELPTGTSAPSVPSRRSSWQLLTGMSLSTMLGVGLGLATMSWMQGPTAPLNSPVAMRPGEVTAPAAPPGVAVQPATQAGVTPVAEVDLAPLWASDVPIRVPVINSPDVPLHWLQKAPERVPANVRARLQEQGYLIDEERQFLVVPLENGQRVLMPHDAVRVRYAVQ